MNRYPLTPMQQACWFVRVANPKQQVFDHLYLEFEMKSINLNGLSTSVVRLFEENKALRLGIDKNGNAWFAPLSDIHTLEVDDISGLSDEEQVVFLESKRKDWSHQQLEVATATVARFSVSVLKCLPKGEVTGRLHIDVDLIALDPTSIRAMVHKLAYYCALEKCCNSDLNGLKKLLSEREVLANKDVVEVFLKSPYCSKKWWKQKIQKLYPPPKLPYHKGQQFVKSQSIQRHLEQSKSNGIRRIANRNGLTTTELMLAIFSFVLGSKLNQSCFRLSVPVFVDQIDCSLLERKLGERANFTLLNVDLTDKEVALNEWCKTFAYQFRELLDNISVSGVDILRELSKQKQEIQMAPVVFTSAIDLPEKVLFESIVSEELGELCWSLSQSAHTTIDLQVSQIGSGLFFNMDVREDLIPVGWAEDILATFLCVIEQLVESEHLLKISLSKFFGDLQVETKKPLTSLQKSYLLGRSAALPLSCSMQACHGFIGSLAHDCVHENLLYLVRIHSALRVCIEQEGQAPTQHIVNSEIMNYSEFDFRDLEVGGAWSKIASEWQRWSMPAKSSERPLWEVAVYILPGEQTVVFTRFDGLILDGRSIAQIICQLCGDAPIVSTNVTELSEDFESSGYSEAQKYWLTKIQSFPSLNDIPWQMDLNSLIRVNFGREVTVIPSSLVERVASEGAKLGLLKNTILMGAIAQAMTDSFSASVYFAIPVLPSYKGALANQSTFIAAHYSKNKKVSFESFRHLQEDVLNGLQNMSFSGVDLSRVVCERHKTIIPFPLVITNTLSWPVLSSKSAMKKIFESIQTPQVALDIRFGFNEEGDLVVAGDFVEGVFTNTQIKNLLGQLEYIMRTLDSKEKLQHKVISRQSLSLSRLTKIYASVLAYRLATPLDVKEDLFELGLELKHLRKMVEQLKNEFGLDVGVSQLVSCRSLEGVFSLLSGLKEE